MFLYFIKRGFFVDYLHLYPPRTSPLDRPPSQLSSHSPVRPPTRPRNPLPIHPTAQALAPSTRLSTRSPAHLSVHPSTNCRHERQPACPPAHQRAYLTAHSLALPIRSLLPNTPARSPSCQAAHQLTQNKRSPALSADRHCHYVTWTLVTSCFVFFIHSRNAFSKFLSRLCDRRMVAVQTSFN